MTETAPPPETDAERPAAGDLASRRSCRPSRPCSSPRREPVKEKDLADLLEATPKAVSAALERLAARSDADERGVRVEKVAGGWRFVTRPEFDSLLRKFHEVTERSRLSLAALETLAIIAYRQPITLPEIQDIRGVNSSSVLKTLLEKKLITTAGKKAVVGTPFLYRTTQDFLIRFGLERARRAPAARGPRRGPRGDGRGARDRRADGGGDFDSRRGRRTAARGGAGARGRARRGRVFGEE